MCMFGRGASCYLLKSLYMPCFCDKIACNFLLNNVYLLSGKALVMDYFLEQ